MIPEEIISFYILLNLLMYVGLTIPLDIMTYRKRKIERIKSEKPRYPQGLWVNSALIMTGIIWIIFVLIPLAYLFRLQFLYFYSSESSSVLFQFVQMIGGIAILIGTCIAILGRLSRWNRAFSWGIPNQLETKRIYSFVRHPLYSSYIFYFIGFPILMLNVFLLPLVLGIPGYYYLSIYEESILLDHFPVEYTQYQKRVKRFIPFIW
jgi:protein-S-isoprenylcysteine O-methyltransferase Ste14